MDIKDWFYRHEFILISVIATASLFIRAALALTIDIFQDEGIYWLQGFQASRFSPHPPGTSLLIRVGIWLFGHGLAGLRVGTLLAGTATVFAAFLLGRDLVSKRAGIWCAVLFASCPLTLGVSILSVPDSPLVLFWLLFIWTSWKGQKTRRIVWWLAAGLFLLLGLLTKYMMVLAVPGFGLALLGTCEGRSRLREAGPWLAMIVGLGLFLCLFIHWEFTHEWETFRYHIMTRHEWGFQPDRFLNYALKHIGVMTPVFFAGAIWALINWFALYRNGDSRGLWFLTFSCVPILFFLLPSLFTEQYFVRVHWDAVGYVSALLSFGCLLGTDALEKHVMRRWKKVGAAGVIMGLLIAVFAVILLPRPEISMLVGKDRPLLLRHIGWHELTSEVLDMERSLPGPKRFIVANSFRTAVCLAFHLNRREGIYTLWHVRHNKYGVSKILQDWGIDEDAMVADRPGQSAIYVHEYHWSSHRKKEDLPERIYGFFKKIKKTDDVYITVSERRLKHFGLFQCDFLELKEDFNFDVMQQ